MNKTKAAAFQGAFSLAENGFSAQAFMAFMAFVFAIARSKALGVKHGDLNSWGIVDSCETQKLMNVLRPQQ